jgi:hypothetical protein
MNMMLARSSSCLSLIWRAILGRLLLPSSNSLTNATPNSCSGGNRGNLSSDGLTGTAARSVMILIGS